MARIGFGMGFRMRFLVILISRMCTVAGLDIARYVASSFCFLFLSERRTGFC